jgi:hypothetical protein
VAASTGGLASTGRLASTVGFASRAGSLLMDKMIVVRENRPAA